jgi:hippurate hydrolase
MQAERSIEGLSAELIAEAVAWRRDLHRHPELAFNERRTSDFVAAQLAASGLAVHRGLGRTGVVGTLARGSSRRAIGIRADMDALPIDERSGAVHTSSASGVMHACGHDGHVAIALAAARACAQLKGLDGTVHFIFQPAEEREGGAQQMIADGLFRDFPCDTIYALHNWPALPLGTCVARDSAMMAAIAEFDVTLTGRGCHGAMPHQGIDPIIAACQLVGSLQSIVSRNVDPLGTAVVSVAAIHGGEAFNVVPDTCAVRGSTRWFDDRVGETLERRIVELSRSVSEGFGCTARVCYRQMYPPTVNDPAAAQTVRTVATGTGLQVLDEPPSMASEDFAVMLRSVPGCYLWLGSGQPEHGLHSPRYDFNDALVPLGAALWVALVRRILGTDGTGI